jgi:hypothetical protein
MLMLYIIDAHSPLINSKLLFIKEKKFAYIYLNLGINVHSLFSSIDTYSIFLINNNYYIQYLFKKRYY